MKLCPMMVVTPTGSSVSISSSAANGEERRHAAIAVIPPIQRRMIVEEAQSAYQQQDEDQRVDPVCQADRDGVPIHDLASRDHVRLGRGFRCGIWFARSHHALFYGNM